MVRRVVATAFWTDVEVIDHYSIEDKYFSLYLKTNAKTTQVGIYPLPKKVMSFETGFTTDVIEVLLDRFSKDYGRILYSKETQEVAVLHSLQYSIFKGGKPVSDLLIKELGRVKDGQLILATYKEMKSFWNASTREFDQTIKEIFEAELTHRYLLPLSNDNQNEKDIDIDIDIDNDNQNDNDNEESWATNRPTNQSAIQLDEEEHALLQRYTEYMKRSKPNFEGLVTPSNIVPLYYEEMVGALNPEIEKRLSRWAEKYPRSMILEALTRSVSKSNPISYAQSIVNNWEEMEVERYKDILILDKKHSRSKVN